MLEKEIDEEREKQDYRREELEEAEASKDEHRTERNHHDFLNKKVFV